MTLPYASRPYTLRDTRKALEAVARGEDAEGFYAWCLFCENISDCEEFYVNDNDCVYFALDAIIKMARDMLRD